MGAGRPRQYDNSEEIELIGNQYFDSLGTKKPTITGLIWHLGFESRQSFYDYEKNEEFSYTIKRLRLRIEAEYEQKLYEPACTGAIFALKNFGWSDKQEMEHTLPQGLTINYNRQPGNDPLE